MKIPIVDDEQQGMELVQATCESQGHDVATRGSATDALAHLGAHTCDLLVNVRFLQKPFSATTLLRTVRDGLSLTAPLAS
jgi:CheY-like chemotaxis protein